MGCAAEGSTSTDGLDEVGGADSRCLIILGWCFAGIGCGHTCILDGQTGDDTEVVIHFVDLEECGEVVFVDGGFDWVKFIREVVGHSLDELPFLLEGLGEAGMGGLGMCLSNGCY